MDNQERIEYFMTEIARLSNQVVDLQAERDALVAQVKELKGELRQEKLIHIGFTNESQVQYVTEDKEEGAFYPNSDHGCYIPVYMLNVHAHRVGPDSKIYCTQLEQATEIASLKKEIERLKERNRKLDVDLLRALFYAPSSPVSAQKAQEIEVWYGKFKAVHLASKEG